MNDLTNFIDAEGRVARAWVRQQMIEDFLNSELIKPLIDALTDAVCEAAKNES
jgi:hypothetical protein